MANNPSNRQQPLQQLIATIIASFDNKPIIYTTYRSCFYRSNCALTNIMVNYNYKHENELDQLPTLYENDDGFPTFIPID